MARPVRDRHREDMTPYVAPGTRQPFVVGPAIVAPLLLLVAGVLRIVDGLDGSYGSGTLWDLGHAMLMFAFVLFGLMVVGLGRVGAGAASRAGATAHLAGTAGALAVGWATFGLLYPAVARPATGVLVVGGVLLLVAGAVGQLAPLVERGALPVWSPLAVVGGAAVALVDLDLLPLAAGILLAGLAPLTGLRLTTPTQRAVSA